MPPFVRRSRLRPAEQPHDTIDLYEYMTTRQLQRAKRLRGHTLLPTFNVGDEVNVRCGENDKKKRQATSAWSARAIIKRSVTASPHTYYLIWITLGLCNESPGKDSDRAYPAFKLRLHPGGARGAIPGDATAPRDGNPFGADPTGVGDDDETTDKDSLASDSEGSVGDSVSSVPTFQHCEENPAAIVGKLVSFPALRWSEWAQHKFDEEAPYMWYTGKIISYHVVRKAYQVSNFKHDSTMHSIDLKTVISGMRHWILLCRPNAATCVKASRRKLNRKGAPTCTVEEVDVSAEDSSQSDLGLPDANTDLDVNPHDKDTYCHEDGSEDGPDLNISPPLNEEPGPEDSDHSGAAPSDPNNNPPVIDLSDPDENADDGLTEILTQR